MKFFERDLCEKLTELGCVPLDTNNYEMHNSNCKRNRRGVFKCKHYNFYLYDFTAPTERARKNDDIIQRILCNNDGQVYVMQSFRSLLVESESEHEAEQTIRKAVWCENRHEGN